MKRMLFLFVLGLAACGPVGSSTPSETLSLRVTLAIGHGVDMHLLLKEIAQKDAEGARGYLQVQGDADEETLRQLRIGEAASSAEGCSLALVDSLERRRIERRLIQAAIARDDWTEAHAIANASLQVALDAIDRTDPGLMSAKQRELAAGLRRLVPKERLRTP